MIVAVSTMFLFRIGAAYLMVKLFDMGIIAIWVAMVMDWVVRGSIFKYRFSNGKRIA